MKKTSVLWLVLIQWSLAIEWLHSGWGKWADPAFMSAVDKILQGFAAKNPYGWYVDFLNSTAIPNAVMFGNLIRTSEMLIGIVMAVGGIVLMAQKRLAPAFSWIIAIALLGAALMNINFFFAAGYTSPSTWGVNLIMALIEIILAIFYITNTKELS